MAIANPYGNTLDNVVFTATKEELTLLLYEGAIKFCNQAIIAIEKKEIEKAHRLIVRVQDIIQEFQITLNRKYEIAEELDEIYKYLNSRLMAANLGKDIEILNEVLELLRGFRDTWKEAMKIAISVQ